MPYTRVQPTNSRQAQRQVKMVLLLCSPERVSEWARLAGFFSPSLRVKYLLTGLASRRARLLFLCAGDPWAIPSGTASLHQNHSNITAEGSGASWNYWNRRILSVSQNWNWSRCTGSGSVRLAWSISAAVALVLWCECDVSGSGYNGIWDYTKNGDESSADAKWKCTFQTDHRPREFDFATGWISFFAQGRSLCRRFVTDGVFLNKMLWVWIVAECRGHSLLFWKINKFHNLCFFLIRFYWHMAFDYNCMVKLWLKTILFIKY